MVLFMHIQCYYYEEEKKSQEKMRKQSAGS